MTTPTPREVVERLAEDHLCTLDHEDGSTSVFGSKTFAAALMQHAAGMCDKMVVPSFDSCARMGGIEDCAEMLRAFAEGLKS